MTHENLKAAYAEDAKRTEKPHWLWQVMIRGAWENLDEPPIWSPILCYRRHPHADKMLAYREGEQWEWYSNSVWRDCHSTPKWRHDLDYRKKPMTLERKQYEADKLTYNEPWLLWEREYKSGGWRTMQHEPCWDGNIQYRRKPEARPHAHLIKLWADGAEIQKLNARNQWVPCPTPCWERTATYRQKPAHQTRWIGVYRMPAASVYIAEGKISREDCKPSEGDTLIKLLEVTINADNSTTVKEHKP